jgi:hypothetical protein
MIVRALVGRYWVSVSSLWSLFTSPLSSQLLTSFAKEWPGTLNGLTAVAAHWRSLGSLRSQICHWSRPSVSIIHLSLSIHLSVSVFTGMYWVSVCSLWFFAFTQSLVFTVAPLRSANNWPGTLNSLTAVAAHWRSLGSLRSHDSHWSRPSDSIIHLSVSVHSV